MLSTRYPTNSDGPASREVFHLGVGGVLVDRVDSFVGVRLCRISLNGDDDLAVRGFEVEMVHTLLSSTVSDALWPLALPRKCLHLTSTHADLLTTPAVVGKIIAAG